MDRSRGEVQKAKNGRTRASVRPAFAIVHPALADADKDDTRWIRQDMRTGNVVHVNVCE